MADTVDMTTKLESEIEKLDETNYHQWKFETKWLLVTKGLWKYVEPDDSTASTSTDWKTRREKKMAYANISTLISSDYYYVIKDTGDPAKAWQALREYFAPKSRLRVVTLRRRFIQTTMEPDESISEYTSRVMDSANELEEAGYPTSDLDTLYTILIGLPSCYDNIVDHVLLQLPDIQFTTKHVVPMLVAHREWKKEKSAVNKSSRDFGWGIRPRYGSHFRSLRSNDDWSYSGGWDD